MQYLLQLLGLLLIGPVALIAQPKLNIPGTLPVADNLYMDQMPITNVDWKEFVYFVKLDSGADRAVYYLPDTSIWLLTNYPDLTDNYYQDPKHNSYPVVGVTVQQAEAYAAWRSAIVSKHGILAEGSKCKGANCRKRAKLEAKGKLKYDTTIRVVYSLPSVEDLAYAEALANQQGQPKGKFVPIADGSVKMFDFSTKNGRLGSEYMLAPNSLLPEYASKQPTKLLWGFRCVARIENR